MEGKNPVPSTIRNRWKGYSEFMFWGSFSYDYKGPCHCWRPETAAEKAFSEEKLAEINAELEPKKKEEWELLNGMKRTGLKGLGGPKPTWVWDKKHGKITRDGKGGIDFWRYQQTILVAKLFPWVKKRNELQRLRGLEPLYIQKNNAAAHASKYQKPLFLNTGFLRLIWPGNSPDLNMIEPAWLHIKRLTTKKGAPVTRADAEVRWKQAWKDLPQEKIQAWIERIPRHIQKVIELEGGNEYYEGRTGFDGRTKKGKARLAELRAEMATFSTSTAASVLNTTPILPSVEDTHSEPANQSDGWVSDDSDDFLLSDPTPDITRIYPPADYATPDPPTPEPLSGSEDEIGALSTATEALAVTSVPTRFRVTRSKATKPFSAKELPGLGPLPPDLVKKPYTKPLSTDTTAAAATTTTPARSEGLQATGASTAAVPAAPAVKPTQIRATKEGKAAPEVSTAKGKSRAQNTKKTSTKEATATTKEATATSSRHRKGKGKAT